MSNKELNKPNDFSKKMVIGVGVIFILAGGYGVFQVGYGWSVLLFGMAIIVYVAPTGKA